MATVRSSLTALQERQTNKKERHDTEGKPERHGGMIKKSDYSESRSVYKGSTLAQYFDRDRQSGNDTTNVG